MLPFPYTIIDLTHALSPDIPSWSGSREFEHALHQDYDPNAVYKFRKHTIQMHEGVGTHMDAPAHCIPGGATIDQIPLDKLLVPAVVIDIPNASDPAAKLSATDVEQFETQHGQISAGCLAMIRSGWSKFWHNPQQYRNDYVFPSVDAEAAQLLVRRGVVGIAVDTLSPDRGDNGFPVHNIMLGAGRYMVENATNLDQLPYTGCLVSVNPMKIMGGTEAPIRLLGYVQKQR
jgi:kynurenine formamidase